MNFISLQSQICEADNLNCREVILKLPAEASSNEELDFNQYSDFFFLSFSATVSLWFFAKFVGLVLKQIRA
ncbi:hypothetical protein OQ257_11435 [Actinobacillus equuli subsp. equuli]|uniref:Uncharacterized protein n=1 Tax=Actinobacillus equuli subsp. equuli TaxID=202947 RepID=A0A9X4G610_ACTEU|nr:hypothetical protein [Actinobacillus equuli]MDE8035768.1 hypothetical protein [Actinobacillus equuli subsp. equuli]